MRRNDGLIIAALICLLAVLMLLLFGIDDEATGLAGGLL